MPQRYEMRVLEKRVTAVSGLSGIIYGHLVTIRLFITCIHFGGLRKFGVSP